MSINDIQQYTQVCLFLTTKFYVFSNIQAGILWPHAEFQKSIVVLSVSTYTVWHFTVFSVQVYNCPEDDRKAVETSR